MELMYLCSADLKTVSRGVRWTLFPAPAEQHPLWPGAIWCCPAGETETKLYFRVTAPLVRHLHNQLARFESEARKNVYVRLAIAKGLENLAPVTEYADDYFPDWRNCNDAWTAPAPERSQAVAETLGRMERYTGHLSHIGRLYRRPDAVPGHPGAGCTEAVEAVAEESDQEYEVPY